MEQSTFEQLLKNFQAQAGTTLKDLNVSVGQVNSPIVVMIHGIGGNSRHWSDPAGVDINETWLFNVDATPQYQNSKILSSPPYKSNEVRSWCQMLSANNISWVIFSQAHSQDALQLAVDELKSLLTGLETVVYGGFQETGEQGPPLILLCHSRGGLVARAATKQMTGAALPDLKKIITLNTPHHGSYMPKLANDYNALIVGKINFTNVVNNFPQPLGSLIGSSLNKYISQLEAIVGTYLKSTFGTQPSGVGFDEMIPGSQMLQTLMQDEQPLPGVQYYSFGGSKSTIVKLYFGIAAQVVHLLDVAGLFILTEFAKLPEIHALYGGLSELVKGDSAVSQASSQWDSSFSAHHQDYPINHMQVLVNQPLQNTVLQIIQN